MDPKKKKVALIGSLVLSAAALGVYYYWSSGAMPSGKSPNAPAAGAASGAPAAGGVGTTFPPSGQQILIVGHGADGCPVMQNLVGQTPDGRPIYGPQWQADVCANNLPANATRAQKAAAGGF